MLLLQDTPWVTKQRTKKKSLPTYQVFCRGIPHAATSDVVKKALQCFTEGYAIRDVLLFRGFAFVDYEREVDAEYIIHAKHPIYILGKTVRQSQRGPFCSSRSLENSVMNESGS